MESNLISRKEACKILGISHVTLWNWTKEGLIQSYGLGSRIYYKKDELLESVKPIKKKKN